jgi:hypothetical protein
MVFPVTTRSNTCIAASAIIDGGPARSLQPAAASTYVCESRFAALELYVVCPGYDNARAESIV